MKLSNERIGKHDIAIEVNGAGRFEAIFDDQEYTAPTLADLMEQLKRAVKKAEMTTAVDVTVVNMVPRTGPKSQFYREDPFEVGRGVVHAKLRGKHERQGAFLLTSDDGKKFKLTLYGHGTSNICRRLTVDEVATYTALAQSVDIAEASLAKFLDGVHLNPAKALKVKE